MRGKLQRLAFSGQGWVGETDRAVYLYVSAAGFTDDMRHYAADNPQVRLLSLEDLYPEH